MVRKLWKRLNDMRLRSKLMVSYLVLITILVLFWSISAYIQIDRQLEEKEKMDFDHLTASVCTALENKIERAQRAILVMARDAGVIETFCTPMLSDYQQADKMINHVDPLLSNINEQNEYIDKVIVYTYYDLAGVREYIRDANNVKKEEAQLLNGKSEPKWSLVNGRLAVSAKCISMDSAVNSATICYLIDSERFFSDALQRSGLDYSITIYNDDQAEIFSCQNSSEDGITMEGTGVLRSNGWKVNLKAAHEMKSLPTRVTISTTAGAVVLALLLIIPLSVAMSRTFSMRVQTLKKQVAEIVPKRYEVDIASECQDEIGEITNAIGEMVEESRLRILRSYQEKIERRDAQIQALQSQINPHFLYNTLSNLNWRAIKNGDMEMSNLLNAMSRFYRMTLNKGQAISTIGDEMEHARLYMRIQCAIHNKELAEEKYDVSGDLIDYHIPTVTLQPLVENAVEHGFSNIGFENGKLCLSARLEGEQIVIRVSDNGTGISQEAAASVCNTYGAKTMGFGLRNVYQRLQLLFENEFKMEFETNMDGGTTVVLRIPPYVQP